jgi:hypothetical protein
MWIASGEGPFPVEKLLLVSGYLMFFIWMLLTARARHSSVDDKFLN